MQNDNLRGVVLMNIAMLAFTLNDTCMKLVTQSLPLYQAITLRGVLTTAALLLVAAGQGVRLTGLGRGDWQVIGLRTLADVRRAGLRRLVERLGPSGERLRE